MARHAERLSGELRDVGLTLGAPVYIRLFKDEGTLELWVQAAEEFERFRAYPICYFSGQPGPKTTEGDRQSPEGIYEVAPGQLNPRSRYHLAFDLGYPNAVERSRGWTGSALMVHGGCVSIGCYAMGDDQIEEIYVLVQAALAGGQSTVPVHAFPFRLTAAAMADHVDYEWYQFWQELQPFYAAFEEEHVPRTARSEGPHYVPR